MSNSFFHAANTCIYIIFALIYVIWFPSDSHEGYKASNGHTVLILGDTVGELTIFVGLG